MKKLLILWFVLFTFSCKNEKEDITPGKWVINKANEPGDNGKLLIDLPKETEWDITIYAAGSTKVLSNTLLQKEFSLAPGNYDLETNHIWIKDVPVEKGNHTRLRAGVLRIPKKIPWTLYDSAKQTVLINSSSEATRGLPIGKYKLTIEEKDHDVEIKDGKTVKF